MIWLISTVHRNMRFSTPSTYVARPHYCEDWVPPSSGQLRKLCRRPRQVRFSWIENDGKMMGISWYNNYIMGISWDRGKIWGILFFWKPHMFFSDFGATEEQLYWCHSSSIPCPSSSQTTKSYEVKMDDAPGELRVARAKKSGGYKGSTAKVGDLHPNFWGVLSFSPWNGRSWPEMNLPPILITCETFLNSLGNHHFSHETLP